MKLSSSFFRAAIFFAVVCSIPFLFPFLRGLAPFWGDLTYLQHPWRIFDSQELMAGRLPLWNPYLYFGMPQAAAMQDGLYYPASILFYFFKFPSALFLFHILHYWLACFLAYLWLRALGFSHTAGLAAGLLFGFSGAMISREPFLNHLSCLALAPALFILGLNPLVLALALSCAFFAGYPPIFVGAVASSLLLVCLTSERAKVSSARGLAAAGLLSAAVLSPLLWPAAQLFVLSTRSTKIPPAEALRFHFNFSDLKSWVSPALGGLSHFNPAIHWWTCVYLGFFGFAAVLYGLKTAPLKKGLFLGSWILVLLTLTLAGSNPLSSWLWLKAPLLGFIRYPGNIAYLLLIPLTLAAAFGAEKLSQAARFPKWILVVPIAFELSFYAWRAFPLAPSVFFSFKGPLVESFQKNLGTHRYLLSPLALEKTEGHGIWDWKARLYGLTNSPFRIFSAGNFGQPMVPRASYDLMDFLYKAPNAKIPARILPWADIRYLLTPSQLQRTPGLVNRGRILWELNETTQTKNLSRAYFLSPREGPAFPKGPDAPPHSLKLSPLSFFDFGRPDEARVAGNAQAGWVFISQVRYPGWKIFLDSAQKMTQVKSSPALGAFQKVPVPKGWKTLFFIYDSLTEKIGMMISTLSLLLILVLTARKTRDIPI